MQRLKKKQPYAVECRECHKNTYLWLMQPEGYICWNCWKKKELQLQMDKFIAKDTTHE